MNASILFPLVAISSVLGVSEGVHQPRDQFTMVSWNVGSQAPDPHAVAARITELDGVALWGFCGVRNERWARLFQGAVEENERHEMIRILSPTRGGDRSLLLYDPRQFEATRLFELGWKDEAWYRPDVILQQYVVVRLSHRATRQEFLLMINCLHPDWTAQQAETICRWARGQSLPIIAAGTYYFQYNLAPQPLRCDGQLGFLALSNGPFHWIRPKNLVRTYDSPFDTIEDFIFVAHATGRLFGRSRVLVRPDEFAGREPIGEHRPIVSTFEILATSEEAEIQRRMIEQILELREGGDPSKAPGR